MVSTLLSGLQVTVAVQGVDPGLNGQGLLAVALRSSVAMMLLFRKYSQRVRDLARRRVFHINYMSHIPTLPTSENASDRLTAAADSNEPANNIMSDVAETTPPSRSPQAERHTECSLASPSRTPSNWSLSPVLDSMYTWSASSPPPTRYLRDVKRVDSLYGGSSARGIKNTSKIIELGDSFLREKAVTFNLVNNTS